MGTWRHNRADNRQEAMQRADAAARLPPAPSTAEASAPEAKVPEDMQLPRRFAKGYPANSAPGGAALCRRHGAAAGPGIPPGDTTLMTTTGVARSSPPTRCASSTWDRWCCSSGASSA
jgi:hypothetical protein